MSGSAISKNLGFAAIAVCIIAGIVAMTGNIPVGIGLFFIGSGCFYAAILAKSPAATQVQAPAVTHQPQAKAKPKFQAKDTAKKDSKPESSSKPDQKQQNENENKVAIYAGNLSPEFTEEDVRRAFEPFGTIGSINVVIDKASGKCKGYAFVEMPVKEEAVSAIEALNGHELAGRQLKVSAARSMPRPKRRRRPKASA